MKNKSEIFQSPERTKFDTIEDEQKYLDEKLSEWRSKYSSEHNSEAEQPKPKKKIRYVVYVLAVILFIVGITLRYTVKPAYIGYMILCAGCVFAMLGLCVQPRRGYYEPVNPFRLKLVRPTEMEVSRSRSKKSVVYSFFFEYEEDGETFIMLTETEYSEEEKQKICESFLNGNLVAAVSLDDDFQAVIIEY